MTGLRFGAQPPPLTHRSGAPEAIRVFRSDLIERGFAHHGPAGQLMKRIRGRWLFVRTGMSAGEYVVYVYTRSDGFHGTLVDPTSVGIGFGSDASGLAELANALVGWDGVSWPVHPSLVPVPEGGQR